MPLHLAYTLSGSLNTGGPQLISFSDFFESHTHLPGALDPGVQKNKNSPYPWAVHGGLRALPYFRYLFSA